MSRYDYILFDADNTLFDFDQSERRALRLTLEGAGCPCNDVTEGLYAAVNRALWARFDRGEVTREWLVVERFAAFLRIMGLPGDPQDLNRAYLDYLSRTVILYPGAEALCRRLSRRYTLAVITNGVASAQRGRFERSPLKELVPFLFISGEMGVSKPQTEYFRQVFQTMGITDPGRALVVGDNLLTDVWGGLNAGADAVWYNPRHLPGDPEIRPALEVDSFDALAALLLE